MPIYEYKCLSCGYKTEKRFTIEKMEKTSIQCAYCMAFMKRQMGTIATFSVKGKR